MVKHFTARYSCVVVIDLYMSQHEALHPRSGKDSDVMSEIVQHIGYEAAMKLAKHFGGTTLQVPMGKAAWLNDVESVLGREVTEKIIWAFGGSDVYIPRRFKEALLLRNISICLEYEKEIRTTGAQGAVNILARRHGFSDRNIWLILKGTDPEAVTAERKRRRVVGTESATRAPAGSVSSKTI